MISANCSYELDAAGGGRAISSLLIRCYLGELHKCTYDLGAGEAGGDASSRSPRSLPLALAMLSTSTLPSQLTLDSGVKAVGAGAAAVAAARWCLMAGSGATACGGTTASGSVGIESRLGGGMMGSCLLEKWAVLAPASTRAAERVLPSEERAAPRSARPKGGDPGDLGRRQPRPDCVDEDGLAGRRRASANCNLASLPSLSAASFARFFSCSAACASALASAFARFLFLLCLKYPVYNTFTITITTYKCSGRGI